MWVIDASVAVKWFFEEEELSDKAQEVLNAVVEAPDEFLVPALFYIEFCAVVFKKSADRNASSEAYEKLCQLGLKTIPVGKELLLLSIQLASENHLSVYDAIYIATAKLMKAQWLTSDAKALKKGNRLGMSLRDFEWNA